MMRESRCPRCRKRLRAAAHFVRPRVRCVGCGHVFRFNGKLMLVGQRVSRLDMFRSGSN
jgi:hypothetical protein